MVTPEDLEALSPLLVDPDNTIVINAANWLRHEDRYGLETAHNLLTDVVANCQMNLRTVPEDVLRCENELRAQRIAAYGAVGRPFEETPPYFKYGW